MVQAYGWVAAGAIGACLTIAIGADGPVSAQVPSAATDAAGSIATPPEPDYHLRVRDRAQRKRGGDLSPANEQADTQRPPPPGLAGDWFGLKEILADKGIGITARYASESALNFTGGRRTAIT